MSGIDRAAPLINESRIAEIRARLWRDHEFLTGVQVRLPVVGRAGFEDVKQTLRDVLSALEASEARLKAAEAERDANYLNFGIAVEERDEAAEQAEDLAAENASLREALDAVQSQCAGHCDEFSQRVWQIAENASLRAQLEERCIEQRVIGHGEGQEHTIADVNAGRVDDLIEPRLRQERAQLDARKTQTDGEGQ